MTHIWEHEYKEHLKNELTFKEFFSWRYKTYYCLIEKYGHINIRDAFFGGRTNNLVFNYVCDENERILYHDVTSLYPSVLVKNKYPLKHPIVITAFEGINISNYFGIIKCKVLPPKDLYIPVLPMRFEKKLYFPLCRSCVELKTIYCNHNTDKERELIGTWFSEELKLALTKGYKIIKIIESSSLRK